ncbi:MAG: glycosyltransferase family 2 protein [Candidatus Scalindua sp.]
MPNQPFVSVIVPVHNAGEYIEICMDALLASSHQSFEIIMVDDCSTDDSVEIARLKGITVLQLSRQSGPAASRNFGALHARGEILIFIDSDVLVRQETITRIVENFQHNPDIVAVFGSYDDEPLEKNFMSQYRNLFHHFHHQHSDTEAFTFWAGCGAIRKKVFEEMGGFDQKKYTKPSIEDIELGYRIHKKGYRIILDRDLQVKHLKRWGFLSMLRTDVFRRAVPWSRLILETKFMPNDLNLQMTHKTSSISVTLMILVIPFLFFGHTKFYEIPIVPAASLFLSVLFVNFLILNRELYSFYVRRKGLMFMLRVIPLHLLYYLYSGISFVVCWISYRFSIPGFLYHMVEKYNARAHRKI